MQSFMILYIFVLSFYSKYPIATNLILAVPKLDHPLSTMSKVKSDFSGTNTYCQIP